MGVAQGIHVISLWRLAPNRKISIEKHLLVDRRGYPINECLRSYPRASTSLYTPLTCARAYLLYSFHRKRYFLDKLPVDVLKPPGAFKRGPISSNIEFNTGEPSDVRFTWPSVLISLTLSKQKPVYHNYAKVVARGGVFLFHPRHNP